MSSITLTFSSRGENYYGNEIKGEMKPGFTPSEIAKGCSTVVDLNRGFKSKYRDPGAYLGVVKGFCQDFQELLWSEITKLEWDAKHWDPRREDVVNKHARTNLLFMWGFSQEPDYRRGKGRVYDIQGIASLKRLAEMMEKHFEACGHSFLKEKFIIEGNWYPEEYGYIPFHGDSERKLVAGVRLGASNPLYFGWWQYDVRTKSIGYVQDSMTCVVLEGGDLYMMSEKAVGTDWENGGNKLPHLRHAAGKLVSLLYKDSWRPYKENENTLRRLVYTGEKADEFESEISFPLSRKNEVLGYLGSLFFLTDANNLKNRPVVDRNWWCRYHGVHKLSKDETE